jgi:hypothetical protein
LTWVARGKTSAEIAQIIGLTKRTVDFHIDNARGKLGAATRTEAVIKATTGRLIEPWRRFHAERAMQRRPRVSERIRAPD